MKLIGITGKAGSGKDTAADYLATLGYSKYSMAGPLKAMLRVIGVDCDDRDTKELPHPVFGVSPRHMAQTLGTEWMRDKVAQDGWIRIAQQRWVDAQYYAAESQPGRFPGLVIPDIRFPDEAAWLRKAGGTLIHIYRPDAVAVKDHISEKGVPYLLGIDHGVVNGATVAELHRKIAAILKVIL